MFLCNPASFGTSTSKETAVSVTYRPRDHHLPPLIADVSAAGVPVTNFRGIQADENDPNYTYSSPTDHYSQINDEAWTTNNNDDVGPGPPYEGLSVSAVDQLTGGDAVTTAADVYVPLRRDAWSNTSDRNKRVRSLPSLGRRQDTVQ